MIDSGIQNHLDHPLFHVTIAPVCSASKEFIFYFCIRDYRNVSLEKLFLEGPCHFVLNRKWGDIYFESHADYSFIWVGRLANRKMGSSGFEPLKALANRFTACPLWPLG